MIFAKNTRKLQNDQRPDRGRRCLEIDPGFLHLSLIFSIYLFCCQL